MRLELMMPSCLRALLVGAILTASSHTANAQMLSCNATGDKATALRRYVQNIVSGTRSSTTTIRTTLGISAMDTSAVALVTSDSICTRVTRVVDSVFAKRPSVSALIVVQFGNRYGAYDPTIDWKGASEMYVLDSAFTYIMAMTAF
jgi:hypothetical protein